MEKRELVEYGVIGTLLFMSFLSVAVAIERCIFFFRIDLNKFKTKQELEAALTKGLNIIAIVTANSPYVGLLGTVIGIIFTFHSLGEQGFANTKELMKGLALALKATAAGLLVAIPSGILYNLLLRKAKVILLKWESTHKDD